jgi:hypothetical protein
VLCLPFPVPTRKERRNGPAAWQEGGSVLTVGEKCPRSLGDLLGNAEGNRDMQGMPK